MDDFKEKTLRISGFEGFQTIGYYLDGIGNRNRKIYREIPNDKGVYLIFRKSNEFPNFLPANQIQYLNTQSFDVLDESELKQKWVEGTAVIYIGSAGGHGSKENLHKRIRTYMRFGAGKKIKHAGGRYIWHLADHRDLLVAWKSLPDDVDPMDFETKLILKFEKGEGKGKIPFANGRH